MVTSRLLPPRPPPELTAHAYRSIIREGRQTIAARMTRARRRALSYARHLRAKGLARGYQAGIIKAEHDCAHVVKEIQVTYVHALEVAHRDIHALSYKLAEQLVDRALLDKPEALMAWIETALGILIRSRPLHLTYHPRYESVMKQILPLLPATIAAASSDAIGRLDFRIEGAPGGVECSIQEALRLYSESSSSLAESTP